jgi:hypothetical protein
MRQKKDPELPHLLPDVKLQRQRPPLSERAPARIKNKKMILTLVISKPPTFRCIEPNITSTPKMHYPIRIAEEPSRRQVPKRKTYPRDQKNHDKGDPKKVKTKQKPPHA